MLLVPAAMVGAHALEQRPTFCASCHEERINYETWLSSSAAKHHPTCIECHTSASLYGIINAQARGAVHLAKHVIGAFEEPLRGTVPREWCTQCHAEDAKLQREHRKLRQFTTASCAECHNHRPGVRFKGEEEEEEHERTFAQQDDHHLAGGG